MIKIDLKNITNPLFRLCVIVYISLVSGIWFWAFAKNHLAIFAVLIGVVGETVLGWERKSDIKTKIKEAFGVIVVVGLAWEIPEAAENDRQAEELRHQSLALQLQIVQASNNIVKIDPLKQPVASVTAFLRMDVAGTNQNSGNDPNRGFKRSVSLSFGNLEHTKTNIWALILSCNEFVAGTEVNGRIPGKRSYKISFSLPVERGGRLWNIGESEPVDIIDKWDTIELRAPFLTQRAKIMNGEVTLIVNSTRRRFPIPQQWYNSRWIGNKGYGESIFENEDTNRVNVRVIPEVDLPANNNTAPTER